MLKSVFISPSLICCILIVLGGDQMTAERTRGCKRIRSNSERGKERLEGFTAFVEDWHAKVALLGVSLYYTNIQIISNKVLIGGQSLDGD